MLADKTIPQLAVIMAEISAAAYNDNDDSVFKNLGFTKTKFIDREGAQAYVSASKTELIVACRGTQPTQPTDLLADLNTIPKRHGVGWVHSGFRTEARKVLDDIIAFVKANKNRDIYVTGHSLGAAMALYVTQELEYAGFQPKLLMSYGQPRLGNSDYVASIKTEHYRFVNCNDLVTHVPPQAMLFKHHGKLCYINFYGNIRPVTNWQRFKDQLRGRFRAWKKREFFDGVRDHLMTNYINKLKNISDTGQDIA